MIPQEAIALSAKVFSSTFLAAAVWVFDLTAQAAMEVPSWATEYGLPGVIAVLLFYAIRSLFQLNQKLQEDWRADRKAAEQARLDDRNQFYNKLEGMFVDAVEGRNELIESNREVSTALKTLSDKLEKR